MLKGLGPNSPLDHKAAWMWRIITFLLIAFNAVLEAHRAGVL
jgi:hypothetical protein